MVGIKVAYQRGRGTYGPKKIQDERADLGVTESDVDVLMLGPVTAIAARWRQPTRTQSRVKTQVIQHALHPKNGS